MTKTIMLNNFINDSEEFEKKILITSSIGDGMNARERRHAKRRAQREALEKTTTQEKWATNIVNKKNLKQTIQKSDAIMTERNKLYYLDWDDDEEWDK